MTLPIMTVEVSAINHPGFRTSAVCRSEHVGAQREPFPYLADGRWLCLLREAGQSISVA